MTDKIRVSTGTSTRELVIDDTTYPAYNGVATVTGDHAREVKKSGDDWLPEKTWSLSGIPEEQRTELQCPMCGRKKLAMFGPTCAWCGGTCIPLRGKR